MRLQKLFEKHESVIEFIALFEEVVGNKNNDKIYDEIIELVKNMLVTKKFDDFAVLID